MNPSDGHRTMTNRHREGPMSDDASLRRECRVSPWLFGAIFLTYSAYATLYIHHTSFVLEGKRFFSLFDDGMISMRYASNLAHGYGLVWNPGGDRVEGYTNPLWVLFMAFFHWLPIDSSKISLYIQVSGAVFLAFNLFFVKRIAELLSNGSLVVALSAMILTAFYLPLNTWGLQGMEVSLLTLLVSGCVWSMLRPMARERVPVGVYVCLAAGTLVRPDMVVPFLSVWAFQLCVNRTQRKQNLLVGLVVLSFFVLLQSVFRLWYYGDYLPNTYYLKMSGYPALARMLRGLYVFVSFVLNFNPVLFLVPFTLLFLRRDSSVLLLLWVFCGQAAYSIYVGGDAWEWWGGSNRYLCIVMPVFFTLLSYAFCVLLRMTSLQLGARRVTAICVVVLLVHAFVEFASNNPRLRDLFGTMESGMVLGLVFLAGLVVRARPELTAGQCASDHLAALRPRTESRLLEPQVSYGMAALVVWMLINVNAIYGAKALKEWLLLKPPLHVRDNQMMVERALLLQRITRPQATLAVFWAGAIPYFADRHTIDLLGKNDRIIARLPMHQDVRGGPNTNAGLARWLVLSGLNRFNHFYPGHLKYDYSYSVGRLRPDVVVHVWPRHAEAECILSAHYHTMQLGPFTLYLRTDSSHILWEQVQAYQTASANIQ